MTVATLYDIHGNLRALEAVLAEIPDDAKIVVGGDVCFAGPQPAETLERLRALGDRVVWVRGNTDREFEGSELDDGQRAFLHGLPPSAQIGRVLYVHATPRNDMDVFTEATPEDEIAFLFEDVDADVVVCGHTHMQFDRTIAGKRVVNSGSVGKPHGDEPGAFWLLDLERRRTEYDGMQAPEMNRADWLAYCARYAITR
ncbi:MAG TPA: metallophosphoesterase family protein [Gaiellaceae bacterium]|nr:metallophosphoesterase family protein [Gaiellaceae bacterium]